MGRNIIKNKVLHKIFKRLKPTPWAERGNYFPVERARLFFAPHVDDLNILILIHKHISQYVYGEINLVEAKGDFIGSIHSTDYSEVFNETADFYNQLINGAAQYHISSDDDLVERWPNIEFIDSNCQICSCLKRKRLPKSSPIVRTFYPPCHFGCDSFVEDSDKKSSRKEINVPSEVFISYICNPIDLLVANKYISDFPGIIKTSPTTVEWVFKKFLERFRKKELSEFVYGLSLNYELLNSDKIKNVLNNLKTD